MERTAGGAREAHGRPTWSGVILEPTTGATMSFCGRVSKKFLQITAYRCLQKPGQFRDNAPMCRVGHSNHESVPYCRYVTLGGQAVFEAHRGDRGPSSFIRSDRVSFGADAASMSYLVRWYYAPISPCHDCVIVENRSVELTEYATVGAFPPRALSNAMVSKT